jgi:hypothetical protein
MAPMAGFLLASVRIDVTFILLEDRVHVGSTVALAAEACSLMQ